MTKIASILKRIIVIIECVALGCGVIVSFAGTNEAVQYSDSYKPYYLYAVLGIVFIVVLAKLWKKRLTIYLGIVMISVYFLFAGFHGYGNCYFAAERMECLSRYEGATVTMALDGATYEWKGEMFTDTREELESVSLTGRDFSIKVDGKTTDANHQVYVKSEKPDNLYYEIYDKGVEGIYLVMEKAR